MMLIKCTVNERQIYSNSVVVVVELRLLECEKGSEISLNMYIKTDSTYQPTREGNHGKDFNFNVAILRLAKSKLGRRGRHCKKNLC